MTYTALRGVYIYALQGARADLPAVRRLDEVITAELTQLRDILSEQAANPCLGLS